MALMVPLTSLINQYKYSTPSSLFNNKYKSRRWLFCLNVKHITSLIQQVLIMESWEPASGKLKQKRKHVKQELMLGSFIIHAHVDQDVKEYISCQCDEECKYVIMNELKKCCHDYKGEVEQRLIFEESKNNGYPQSLTKRILRENTTLFQYLTEIYSIYMHLEILHPVIAELLFETKFQSSEEKYSFHSNFEGNQIILIYQDCKLYYKFTIFYLQSINKEVIQTEVHVKKDENSFQSSEALSSQLKIKHIASENQWIVFFCWLLTTKNNFNSTPPPNYTKIIANIQKSSQVLERKINEIRKRSYTLLYNFEEYYKD